MSGPFSLLFPRKCPGCGVLVSTDVFCGDCLRTLPRWDGALPRGAARYLAPFYYAGGVRKALLLLKRTAPRYLVDFFAARIAALIREKCPRPPELVVCVPMAGKRRRARGFNQAEALARRTAKALDIPFCRRGLRQIRETRTQHTLEHGERRENVRGAFSASGRHVAGRRLLLIDDIITTGSTVAACRDALLDAGAAEVALACAASAQSKRRSYS